MRLNNILEGIGNTAHLRLNRLFPDTQVWIKLERENPGGSIKDRVALNMIEAAEQAGDLKPGSVIIEPTSGNTGIGLAMAGAVKNYRVILVMPDSMSVERRKIMAAYGAEFELSPRAEGMKGAMRIAQELQVRTPNSWIPSQFTNPANPQAHYETTAREIMADFPQGLDYLITAVGTGGHISGVTRALKERFPNLQVFAVEPELSPVISGGEPGPHPLQGIGAGFIPENLAVDLLDGSITVTKEEAFEFAVRIGKEEGVLAGISTGASLAAVNKKLPDLEPDCSIMTFCYDTGERYLSVDGLF